ncbi:hypothetical protein HMPREF9374_1401 [Desmospora sp. 8437]|nr:hypothetical protein HMPREF9374_1401 [Desmospora sp. 8437]
MQKCEPKMIQSAIPTYIRPATGLCLLLSYHIKTQDRIRLQ